MKGVILSAFGEEKLLPLTLGIPKHLLPIYDKPMVYYPLDLLLKADVKEILIITTEDQQSIFEKALGNGERFGATFLYLTQDKPKGIAYAISIAEDFIGSDSVCVITGDTILVGGDINTYIKKAAKALKCSGSATAFMKRNYDKEQYGKVVLNNKGQCLSIEGLTDAYNYGAIVGLYVFPSDVVKKAKSLNLSCRGRKEITDLFCIYHDKNKLQVLNLKDDIIWFDTNSPESIMRCSNYMFTNKNRIEL